MKSGKGAKAAIERLTQNGLLKPVIYLAFGIGGAYLLGNAAPEIMNWLFRSIRRTASETYPLAESPQTYVTLGLLGFILGLIAATAFVRAFETVFFRWDKLDTGDKVTLFLGTLAGIVTSLLFLQLFNALQIPAPWIPVLILACIVGFSALCVYALHSMEEVLPWSKLSVRTKRSGIKLLDTNVIIDGRIYDVARSGFLDGELYVPGFVLDELQKLSDNHDALKRQRGRRGLDILRHMQAEFPLEIRIHDKAAPPANDDVDGRLVRLAKALGGDIVTNDWNLNRVASLQEVRVLNLNDLALALRPNVLPGEALELTILREGQQYGQGIGYLEDGTMVVVQNGRNHLGETMDVMVSQVIQTERGKMIFAEVPYEEEDSASTRRRPTRRN
jgi:uncharacterized protein YacL